MAQEKAQIKSDEGLRLEAYWDVNGWSIGWGHRTKHPSVISLETAEELFEEDYTIAKGEALRVAPEAPEEVQMILTNMAYNLGGPRLRKFERMLNAIDRGCYDEAADEMERSLWYTQVGNRSKRLVDRMRRVDSSWCIEWNG